LNAMHGTIVARSAAGAGGAVPSTYLPGAARIPLAIGRPEVPAGQKDPSS
jgi:hypothetical protein